MQFKYILIAFSLIFTLLLSFNIELNWLLQIGVFFTFHFFLKLVLGLGKTVPIKELMSLLLLIQFVITPLITYRYFDNQASFKMFVSETVYFGYSIPAALSFILGLNLPILKNQGIYKQSVLKIERLLNYSSIKAYVLVVLGFLFFLLGRSLSIPSLYFVFYLGGLLRFVGAFILVMSNKKFDLLVVAAVFTQFTIEIISGGVFYDLFVWLFFLYALIEFKLKSSFLRKLLFILIGGLTVYFVQSFKKDYRKQVWGQTIETSRAEVFIDIATDQLAQNDVLDENDTFDAFISRLNTGWILSKVLEHTPIYEPFSKGVLLKEDLINVFLPRFLFPNKVSTGGKQNQEKFTRFTGRRLTGGTTMRIGAISDGYVNFGFVGGWLTLFFLGLIFNLVLYYLIKKSIKNPFFILWIPFVFAYAVRMSDIQVILNYTLKSLFVVLVINYAFFNNRQNEIKNE